MKFSISEEEGQIVTFKRFDDYKERGEIAHFIMIQGRLRHGTGKPANFPSVLAVLSKE